ncbi:RNA-binding domain-containing protein [Mycena sanguinolenta]|uniref:RNA-binding domain-containing protein n=1 Tax=Mycena sanguinolenta TaxID=230812 RepID=A0A8H7CYC2_9AGAR|nr:RNA-binding domain-containing protein [Mycena sanguinolenta]
MSTRGRSTSPRPIDQDADMDKDSKDTSSKPGAKVVIITNLSRNVVETHLKTIFGFYGEIVQIDLPVYGKSGQNRGKAALEYADPPSAQKAASHMNGGQIDGAVVKVELSDLPRSLALSFPAPSSTKWTPLAPGLSLAPARVHPDSADETAPGVEIRTAVGPLAQPLSLSFAHSPRTARPLGTTQTLTELPTWRLRPETLKLEELLCSFQPFTLAIHVAFSLPLALSFSFVFVVLAL